jgi:hypothetical protein
MTVGDTLDGAFRMLRSSWPTVLVATLLLVGVVTLVSTAMSAPILRDLLTFDPAAGLQPVEVPGPGAAVGFAVGGLLSFVGVVAAEVATLWAVRQRDLGDRATVGAAIVAGLRRTPGLLLVVIALYLAGFIAVGLFALLSFALGQLGGVGVAVAVVLGIAGFALLAPAWLAVVLILPAVVVLEGRGAWAAFGRSLRVVGRRFWRTVGMMWLLLLVLMVLGVGLSIVSAPLLALPEGALLAVYVLQQVVTSVVAVPILVGIGAMLLLDASARLDGADLTARAQGLASNQAPGW